MTHIFVFSQEARAADCKFRISVPRSTAEMVAVDADAAPPAVNDTSMVPRYYRVYACDTAAQADRAVRIAQDRFVHARLYTRVPGDSDWFDFRRVGASAPEAALAAIDAVMASLGLTPLGAAAVDAIVKK